MKKYASWFIIVSILLNIALSGFLLLKFKEVTGNKSLNEGKNYPYLSKRIFAENQNDILINFVPLRERLKTYVRSLEHPIGMYFEYLPSGVSIGINEKMETNIASLLKVPLIMAVYKQFERGTLTKTQPLTIKKEMINNKFGTLWRRGEGATLTVEEAIALTLEKSDNTASNLLLAALPPTALDDVADYLDIPKTKEGKFIVISPKNYTSILRSLYLSSYLPNKLSNEILDILTKTELNDMLPAGIEDSVPIAHKVGIYTLPNAPQATFSDCGIVYVPQRPYILCIMTNTSKENAHTRMIDMSKMIYKYVKEANQLR